MSPGLKYGLYAATGMTAWLFAAYALGLHNTHFAVGRFTDWGTELILVLALWRLLRNRLYAENRYWLPVWQGLLHGAFASLVAAMCYYIVFSAYLRFVNPHFPDLYMDWRVAQLRAANVPELEIRPMIRNFYWSVSPVGLPLSIGGFYLLIGIVASPLLTLWLNWRRKEVAVLG